MLVLRFYLNTLEVIRRFVIQLELSPRPIVFPLGFPILNIDALAGSILKLVP